MKRIIPFLLVFSLLLAGCGSVKPKETVPDGTEINEAKTDETHILLSDNGVTVDGENIGSDSAQAVYAANDIVYYEEGRDFTYGEGTAEDEHSADEAAAHTVVHITRPGTYRLSGTLSQGQIAVDLGEGAKTDPSAVVTLILDGVNVSCTVAPAVIFYNVYECGDKDDPRMDVDTTAAGANVLIADGSTNNITGSYVARIYESVVLSQDGTEVVDSKKLHKYDAAFYSKMSMNVSGGQQGNGVLNITAENEGLDSELHLTVNGGMINIISGNDGINTNEDGVSVTTINDGSVYIYVNGSTGEGDGIDSNGWLVINGGSVKAAAYALSADSGIDADNGVYINGGTVVATGNMLDRIEGSQTWAVFSFARQQSGGTYTMRSADGNEVLAVTPNAEGYINMIISSPKLIPGTYTLWLGEQQLGGFASQGGMGGFGGPFVPGERPEPPEGFEEGERPGPWGREDGVIVRPIPGTEGDNGGEGRDGVSVIPIPPEGEGSVDDDFNMAPPERGENGGEMPPPEGFEDGMGIPGGFDGDVGGVMIGQQSSEFVINEGANYFSFVDVLSAE